MKNDFELMCESISTTLKQTKIFRYPRQISLSEEFVKALAKEVSRHMQMLDESKQPIRDLPEKFLKALKFELSEITEKQSKKIKVDQMSLRPRHKWTINPTTKVHGTGKKPGYDRAKEKQDMNKET